jgi:peptidoglycan/xylan/chitin deacetylase (PgdA/CDA1 family)
MSFLQRLFRPESPGAAEVHSRARRVWLTFDDGPSREITPLVLKALRRHRVKATFFVVGAMVANSKDLLTRILGEGHRVGNHSYSHRDLRTLTDLEIVGEVRRTEAEIARHMVPDKIFRPPFGLHDDRVDAVLAAAGYRMILWDVEPRDWDPEFRDRRWVTNGIDFVRQRDCARIVLHDIHRSTADNLDRFIAGLKAEGDVVLEEPSSLQ